MGVINVLGIAKRTKAKILQASTSEVYGDPDVHPQNESYWGKVNPVGIRSCYDEGKRAAECLMMDYRRQNGVNTKIVRIFNTYGPRMRAHDGRVVPAFIGQALAGQPLTVFGDGQQTRSFCYVDDEIEGIVRLLLSEITDPVNIGNPAEMTVLQFAEAIRRLTGNHVAIEHRPLPVDDPKVRQPDISLARTRLGWAPRVPLEEGLRRTIEYFRRALLARC